MFKKIALLLMVVVALGACSKSKPAASGSDEPTTGATTSEPADTTDGDPEVFCDLGASTFAENPFQGFDPTSPETLREGFQAAVEVFQNLLAVAPADVAVTIEDGVAAMVEIEATLDAADYDFSKLTPEDSQRFTELADAFDLEAFAVAAQAYCG